MSHQDIIEKLWDQRDQINFIEDNEAKKNIENVLNLLDEGKLRVCEKIENNWRVNQWLKKAILLSFRIQDMEIITGGPSVKDGSTAWWDKVPSKFQDWKSENFQSAGFRAVPNCVVRRSAFIAKSAVLMPCVVNLGAYVDEGTMVDTWATVGSCAQVGKNCHISGGAGIGGVLEPLQANPVIIEDNCFIGASTKIYNRETKEIYMGKVPPYSVVVPGSLPSSKGDASLYCVVIVKTVDEKTRSKTSVNELLRD